MSQLNSHSAPLSLPSCEVVLAPSTSDTQIVLPTTFKAATSSIENHDTHSTVERVNKLIDSITDFDEIINPLISFSF